MLALNSSMLIYAGESFEVGARRLTTIMAEWRKEHSSLSADDIAALRSLFGEEFLTNRYYLTNFLEITESKNGQ